MMKPGLIMVISSPSGTGKTTICRELITDFKDYQYSISATTRKPRGQEKNGIDYYFMSKEEFLQAKEAGEFIETAQYIDQWYGTPLRPALKAVESGKIILLDIDIQGGRAIKGQLPQAVTVFLLPPSLAELERRLIGRGTEAPELIKKRLVKASDELKCWNEYDYVVVNDVLDEAVKEVNGIVCAERNRTTRLTEKIYWQKSLIELLGLNGNRR